MYRKHNKALTAYARQLRQGMTQEERKLWYEFLRGYPVRFLRQKVIGQYIVDFYCAQAGLVLEVDGGQHYEEKNLISDKVRSLVLRQYGLAVLRFTNLEIKQNFSGVCEAIELLLKERIEKKKPNPTAAAAAPPFDKGGKGLDSGRGEIAAANVPLAKGGRPAGPGGFCQR